MGSRTPDLLNAIQTLYQLSYTPKVDVSILAKGLHPSQTLFIGWGRRGGYAAGGEAAAHPPRQGTLNRVMAKFLARHFRFR